MAEALISVLLEQLASIIKKQVEQEVRLVVDVKKEVAKLTRNFKAIQVALENAEERQMKEVDVRYWLDSLKDVSYEMDDVLDEWSTEILKQHIQKQEKEAGNAGSTCTTKKVRFCIPAPWFCFGQVSQVTLRRDIAVKIKELNERLALIASERQNYNFQYMKRGIEQIERQKSSSFIDKTFGRVDEKDKVVEKLLSGSGQGRATCLVIPIIGMGGIGKTTLAQLAYNDDKVQAHFNTRIWVCVSDPFDEIKIAKAIIDGLKKGNTPASNELQTLLEFIHESVKGMKFLLVLDDVWNHRKWEQLKLPKGIARLTSLRKLDEVRILDIDNNKEALFELSDLRNLDRLRGSFRIEFPEDLKDARQAEKAHLVNKNCLVSLEFKFPIIGTTQCIEEEIVNALQPHPNLESLSIKFYNGATLRPHWMTSLNKLRSLYLIECVFVEFVPPLGRLESLEVLEIHYWPRLKKVGVEFLGIDGTLETKKSSSSSSSPLILFPSLKKLVFHMLPMWEGMIGWSEEEESQKTITIMPCLSSLRIDYCPSLKTLPNFLRNTHHLKELVIDGYSPTLAQGCRKGRGEWPKISHIPNIKVHEEFVQKDGVDQT